jgi:hypothetical protein
LNVRAWSWAKRIATETGMDPDIPIAVERAVDGEGYAFRLGVRAGFGGQDTARIPIGRWPNPAPHPLLKEVHSCEVAGRTLEAANVYALRAKVATVLAQLAPGGALPVCYFRAPAMDYELPVYEEGGEFVSPVIGGPNLKGDDLAAIRRHICRHLINAGYVSEAEEVTVGVLRPSDLRQVPPAAVLRSFADRDLWMPAVEGTSPEGPVVGVVGQATRLWRDERRLPIPGPRTVESAPAAPNVIELLRFLRTELVRARAIDDPTALYAGDVREEIWAAAERGAEDTGTRLVAYLSDEDATTLELPIRRTGFGEVATALHDRGGIAAFLAAHEGALADAVGRYLAAEEFLRFASEVEVHATAPPRAERLDADDIRTSGDGYAAAAFAHTEEEA